MAKTKMTGFAKFLIIAVAAVGIFFAVKAMKSSGALDKIAPKGGIPGDIDISGMKEFGGSSGDDVIDIVVVTWGGYAAGQYFNNGFNPSKRSRFFTEYGIKVKFHENNNFDASLAGFKTGKYDLHWATADAFPTMVEGLQEFNPKIIFQADWSRGGDAIVVRQGINSANDLMAKKIAVAYGSPSHTFILYVLAAGGLQPSDVDLIPVSDAIVAASDFKAGKVDAAVVWSPDDEDCLSNVKGSKILMNTKNVKYLIADVFFAKQSFIDSHQDEIESLIRGWMIGAAEINSSDKNKRKAAKILAAGFDGFDESFTYNAINNVRLCNLGDNLNFFGLNSSFSGITGKRLYNKMSKEYKKILIAKNPSPWSQIVDASFIRKIMDLKGQPGQLAEGKVRYTKPETRLATAKPVATKKVTINFAIGSSRLNDNMKQIIDFKFADILQISTNRVRVEGNTDNTGSKVRNISLSKERAQSVVKYLSLKYRIDRNRFLIKGNGSANPIASNASLSGRSKNRRTEFMLLGSN